MSGVYFVTGLTAATSSDRYMYTGGRMEVNVIVANLIGEFTN